MGNTYAVREASIEDLREAFLANASAKNLAVRSIEWYERHTAGLRDWCNARGIDAVVQLGASHLDDYLLSLRACGAADHTVRGAAQVAKTLARFGYRRGYLPEEITRDFSLPKVAQTIIVTFTDEQLHALLDAPDQRRWVGVRDRAILVLLLDTLARISEISGLNLADVDLEGRSIRVMGKGRKQRDLPCGQIAAQALRRYARSVGDHRPTDPFFISRNGRRLGREGVAAAMRTYARRAKIDGVRCSPHTLRHTGAKRFILSGGDVFTLQRLLGHTSLAMVRRYVELANADVRVQHERFSPADTLLRRPHPS